MIEVSTVNNSDCYCLEYLFHIILCCTLKHLSYSFLFTLVDILIYSFTNSLSLWGSFLINNRFLLAFDSVYSQQNVKLAVSAISLVPYINACHCILTCPIEHAKHYVPLSICLMEQVALSIITQSAYSYFNWILRRRM